MKNLQLVRESWEAMEREDTRLLREMTIEESVRTFLSLCHTMSPLIDATKDIFLSDRLAYLTELQEKLRIFGEWKRRQNGNCGESA